MAFYNGNLIPGLGANILLAQIDESFNPESENAQSGKAVAEALANVGGGDWELIEDITLTETVTEIKIPKEVFANVQYKEIHIEMFIVPSNANATTFNFSLTNGGSSVWTYNIGSGTKKLYFVGDVYLSPNKTPLCNGSISNYYYSGGTSFVSPTYYFMSDTYTFDCASELFSDVKGLFIHAGNNEMTTGTRLKVWGR